MVLLGHRNFLTFGHIFDDGKMLLTEVSLFWNLTHLKRFLKSDHLDFVTNLRFFFLTPVSKSKEETVNHTLNKTSKTRLRRSDYQYQSHHICQDWPYAWTVKLNRLERLIGRKEGASWISHGCRVLQHALSKQGKVTQVVLHTIPNRDGSVMLPFGMEDHIKLHFRDLATLSS